jgi:uncharacterized membrane protein
MWIVITELCFVWGSCLIMFICSFVFILFHWCAKRFPGIDSQVLICNIVLLLGNCLKPCSGTLSGNGHFTYLSFSSIGVCWTINRKWTLGSLSINTTCDSNGAGTAYPSSTPEFLMGFAWFNVYFYVVYCYSPLTGRFLNIYLLR